ncbi:cadherin-86C-like [Centruroides sculpturatus]|uniref:cadherin-86C-like n=1 Tax=Centruroides sculpturatus TaxID=218467 RepID=UPI000C6EF34D|nr:cadherin-86C-like [Centruroides sculpturatus]
MVSDTQDTPPIFKNLPPVVAISESVKTGDQIFKITAEDGDFGKSRNVTYSIVPGSSSTYFSVNQLTGAITLSRPMQELRQLYASVCPLILEVKASEVVSGPQSALTSSTAEVALVLLNTENHSPRFMSTKYVGNIEENSPPLTAVKWEGATVAKVVDEDRGKNGTFQLYLEGDGGIFEVQPSTGINEVTFALLVKNPTGLDYELNEKEYLDFTIVARETESTIPLSSTADIRIKIIDTNDNIPQFKEERYEATIPEDAVPGTTVVKIEATDKDSGEFGEIRYTSINGPIARNLNLDPQTGIITLVSAKGLDRERVPEYTLTVEARDDRGRGNKNVVELLLKLADSNDNAPMFLQPRYNAVLNPDMKSFTERLIVSAEDADSPGPNSNIRYEIVNGNYQGKFSIDEKTGEIRLKDKLTPSNGQQDPSERVLPVITLVVRAHDQGVPVRSSTVAVQVHNQEYLNRTITFILPEHEEVYKDRKSELERGLSSLTGAHVNIHSIKPYNTSRERSLIKTWVAYPLSSTIDLTGLQFMVSDIFGRQYLFSDGPTVETVRKAQFDTVFWLLIVLVIILILALFALCCYCCMFRRKKEGSRSGSAGKVAPAETIMGYQENGTSDNQDGNRSSIAMRLGWKRGYPRFWRRPMSAIERGEKRNRSEINLLDPRRNGHLYTPESRRREEEYLRTLEEHLAREGRMERIYRQGRPISPNNEILFDQPPPEDLSGRQLGKYVIFRKDVDPRNRDTDGRLIRMDNYPLDSSDRTELSPDHRNEAAKRTEILYIRSPPREDIDQRYYTDFVDGERVRGTGLHRSVSETAIHGTSRTSRIPRYSDYRDHDRLKFSRYHRRDSDVYLDGDVPPRDGRPEPYQPPSMSWNRRIADADSRQQEEYIYNSENKSRNHVDTSYERDEYIQSDVRQTQVKRTKAQSGEKTIPRTATIRKAAKSGEVSQEVKQETRKNEISSQNTRAVPGASSWGQEDDSDSGIGRDPGGLKLKKNNLLEKKSLFTIAYDGMQTQRLKSEDGGIPTP